MYFLIKTISIGTFFTDPPPGETNFPDFSASITESGEKELSPWAEGRV